jgi:hypothetical protein
MMRTGAATGGLETTVASAGKVGKAAKEKTLATSQQKPPKATPKETSKKRKADELVEGKYVSMREGGNRVPTVRGAGYGTNPQAY